MPATNRRNVVIQERDVSLLAELFESRVLSLDHIRALCFPGKDEMAKKRVQRLKDAGLVIERPRRIGEPSLLHLTWRGYVAIRDVGHVTDDSRLSPKFFARRMDVSEQTLAHELAVADFKAAVVLALRDDPHRHLKRFDVWPRRCAFEVAGRSGNILVKPDGFIRIEEDRADERAIYDFFLEVDMGTESQDRLVAKCLNYREHYRSGGYAVACGGTREDPSAYPFRVLVTCRSEARQENLAKRLLALTPPIRNMVLITTRTLSERNPLGSVWTRPAAMAGQAIRKSEGGADGVTQTSADARETLLS